MKNIISVNSAILNRGKIVRSGLILLFSILCLRGEGQSTAYPYIDSLAGQYLLRNNGFALIIGINHHGKEEIFYYGQVEQKNPRKPGPDDLFEVGQLTQVFTSILYADLTVKGIIRADDELRNFLPVDVPAPIYEKIVCSPVSKEMIVPVSPNLYSKYEYTDFVCKPDPEFRAQPILLCYLSTHTSGLPDNPSNLHGGRENPYAGYSKDDLYDFLKQYTLTDKIGYDFRYSNLGIALLGHAMELKTRRSYEELINDSICAWLGMKRTHVTLPDSLSSSLLSGHSAGGKVTPHWTFDVMAPCGGLHSDITDMMKFLSANLGTEKTPLKDILDYTHNPRVIFHNKQFGDASVALSWLVSPLGIDNRVYVWQEGLTGGFATFIGFEETRLNGVTILSNSAIPVAEMGKEIVRRLGEE